MNKPDIVDACRNIAPLDLEAGIRLQARLDQLTKPPGSLGRLETLALQIGRMQGTDAPRAARKLVVVMAADHGVCAAGVSAYPSAVTGQMVKNFVAGGAAINVLARHAGARVLVVDMGVLEPPFGGGYLDRSLGRGTDNFLAGPAMSETQALTALQTGIDIATQEAAQGLDLIAGGDMGIGNTTASSVLTALVTGQAPEAVTGRGTGIEADAWQRKVAAVAAAVALHQKSRRLPPGSERGIDLLRRAGGFEIAGLAGLMLGAAAARVPIVLDGFIATSAALAAAEICPSVKDYLIAAHVSAEPGHSLALRHLELEPLLQWNLRLGEGTGAALVFPLLEAACRIPAEMATFASAGVAGRSDSA